MEDDISTRIVLDVEQWLDAPQPAIDAMRAVTSGRLVIEAANASEIPAQVAQLLIAARQSAVAGDIQFDIDQPSEAVKRSLALLGLSEFLLSETS